MVVFDGLGKMEHGESAMLWYIPVKIKSKVWNTGLGLRCRYLRATGCGWNLSSWILGGKQASTKTWSIPHLYTQNRGSRQ